MNDNPWYSKKKQYLFKGKLAMCIWYAYKQQNFSFVELFSLPQIIFFVFIMLWLLYTSVSQVSVAFINPLYQLNETFDPLVYKLIPAFFVVSFVENFNGEA